MATIESVLHENRLFAPDDSFVNQANLLNKEEYYSLCKDAEEDYEGFWGRMAREYIQWHKPFTKVLDKNNHPFFKWFEDGKLNVSYNCLDRNLDANADKIAIIFESDEGNVTNITYRDLHLQVCQFANGLRSLNIKKGDRVIIYMPMSIEAVVAMQACSRIGAIHSVVFGGFSAKSLHERIVDTAAVAVITADEQMRGGRSISLKPVVDKALEMSETGSVSSVVIYQRTGTDIEWHSSRDIWWHELIVDKPVY